MDKIRTEINKELSMAKDPLELIDKIKVYLNSISPMKEQPVNLVRWIPIEDVTPNDYNPNSVASKEMGLLYTSIKHDGYTQPIVTIYDKKKKKYIINKYSNSNSKN